MLYWANQGWVDYLVPQIYWEIGHKVADYDTLIKWWSRYASMRPLVIGQDVERTVKAKDLNNPSLNQLPEKMRLQRTLPGIVGSCLWYSAAVVRNEGRFADALKSLYHTTIALQPAMPFIDAKAPGKPRSVKAMWMPDGYYLFWTAPKTKNAKRFADGTISLWGANGHITPDAAQYEMDKANRFAVYRFEAGEKVDLTRADRLLTVTSETMLKLPYDGSQTKYTYVVTALDRLQNESKPAKKTVRL